MARRKAQQPDDANYKSAIDDRPRFGREGTKDIRR